MIRQFSGIRALRCAFWDVGFWGAAVCVVFYTVLCTAGCTAKKAAVAVAHDPANCVALYGDWNRTLIAETELHEAGSQSDGSGRVAGVARFKAVTVQSFFPDRTFRTEMRQEFVSFVPTAGESADNESSIPETDLRAFFDRTVAVTGSYAASERLLQYESVSVQLPDGTSVPYAEYVAMNPQMGSAVQTVSWRVDGDTLYLRADTKLEPVETEFRRAADGQVSAGQPLIGN